MRVVICVPNGPTGERFESALHGRGFDVVRVDRLSPAQVEDLHADVFVCDRRTTRVVRASSGSAYIVTTLPRLEDKLVASAVEAGAVDVMTNSAGPEELVTRVTLPTRLARAVGEPVAPTRADAWGDARGAVTRHLETLFHRPVRADEQCGEQPSVAATIRLTSAADGTTLELVAGCSKASARALLEVLAPGLPPSAAVLRDGLRETVNNLAGALKRSLREKGVGVTLGLPGDCDADIYATATTRWRVALGDAVLCLGLRAGRADRRSLPICELRPGMVLQHDVLNAAGMPFVRTGTALTERTIERLGDVLGPSFAVSVTVGEVDDADTSALEDSGMVLFEAV